MNTIDNGRIPISRMHAAGALVFTSIAAAILIYLSGRPSPWGAWLPASCMPDQCFCERIRPTLVQQPVNAVSGLAFLPIGIIAFLFPWSHNSSRQSAGAGNLMSSRAVYPMLFGAAIMLIGVGTVFYHASLTFWGQTADVLSMFLLATFLILYNVSRLRPLSEIATAAAYILSNSVLLYLLVTFPETRRYAFAALIFTAVALEYVVRRRKRVVIARRYFAAALAILAAGFGFWVLDITGVLCWPESWFQAHAVWHVCGAVATGLVFLFYLSERVSAAP